MNLGKKLSKMVYLFGTVILCNFAYGYVPSQKLITLSFPFGYAELDAAGYSDAIFWGLSPYHPYGSHELLSGEWGAAIYYNGISTEPNAMWLTNYFKAPFWTTNSKFEYDDANKPRAWDDPNNPVVGNDSGRSIIENNDVEITIDYEIADLGDGNFSPLMYHEPNGTIGGKMSERYVLLQTYTIKSIKPSGDINGLEFYQMLHSHGADDYGPVVHCSYETLESPDALAIYRPYNPVHRIGNFRFDITQWNDLSGADHTDWVGFSCTVEPNVYECNYYSSDSVKPASGAHIDIENRGLDTNDYSYGRTAGAMGWYLPTLAPGQSTSVTVAFMFGTLNWPAPTILTKVNADPNNECVAPIPHPGNNTITFDICYDANDHPIEDVLLTDYLPTEVNYDSSAPEGIYDPQKHTVSWYLGDLGPEDSGCFEVVCSVNKFARPCDAITNHVVLDSSCLYYKQADCNVDVCPWGSEIIYVDKDASGFNNGTSWNDAYKDLQDAFDQARNCQGVITAIWVAAGTYKPVNDINVTNYQQKSFVLPDSVALIGHFGGIGTYETSPDQRNLADVNNETILEGRIGDSVLKAVKYVVKSQNIENSVIDGFTIKDSYMGAGIYLVEDADVSIINCKIKDNQSCGIYISNYSYPDVHNCTLTNNTSYGIYIFSHCWPEISNCIFDGNSRTSCGIQMGDSVVLSGVLSVDNSLFKRHTTCGLNGSDGTLTLANSSFDGDNYGLNLSDVTTTMSDCNISNSSSYGIYASGCGGLEIKDCSIKNSGTRGEFDMSGLYSIDSDVTIDRSVISNSGDNGIYTSFGSNLTVKNSVVRYSRGHGIELHDNLVTTIKNSWIHNNGTYHSVSFGGAGIYFNNQSSVPLVRNNTIYDNWTYGIQSGQSGADPNVINCIISDNNTNDFNGPGGSFETVNYCLLQHPHSGNGNITGSPGFMNPADPNNLHIGESSQCRNAGDPNGNYGSETDIDGELRIVDGRVDIGGDEYYWSKADYNKDQIVNFIDFAVFGGAWQDQNQDVSLDADGDVDIDDLGLFCKDWLWQPVWVSTQWMMSGDGAQGDSVSVVDETSAVEIAADTLMLANVQESMLARPARLQARTDKFYEIKPTETISALRQAQQLREVDSRKSPILSDETCMTAVTEFSEESAASDEVTDIEPLTVEELVDWLDDIWQTGELTMNEQEYLEFRSALLKSAE